MHRGYIKLAAIFGMLSVILGAFAAHKMKDIVGPQSLATFETGVRYQFYHVFALAITAIVYRDIKSKSMIWAGRAFITGIILFSFSLYALTFVVDGGYSGFKWLGPITPIGGAAFIAGWFLLMINFFKKSASIPPHEQKRI